MSARRILSAAVIAIAIASGSNVRAGDNAQAKEVIRCRLEEIPNARQGVLFVATRADVDPEVSPMEAWALTDADGSCRLEVRPGSYWVSYTPREHSGEALLTHQPKAGAQRTEITFFPRGSAAGTLCWIRGAVKRDDGQSAKDAWVHAVRQSDKALFHAQTDVLGHFGFCADKDEFAEGDSFHLFADAPGLRSEIQTVTVSTATELVLEPFAPAGDLSAPDDVVAELARHASAWKNGDPSSALDDLQPMKKLVGDTKVVSIGEAAYGTHELFRAERRMAEFLVGEMGFSVIAIEANWPETLAVNDYVVNGAGDPKQALADLRSLTWSSEEALEFVQWLRRWNADEKHATKVRVEGFDMQYTSVAYRKMHDFILKVDEESAERVGLVLAAFRQADPSGHPRYESIEPELRDAARAALQDVMALLDESKEIYLKRSNANEWAIARRCTVILSQAEEMMRAGKGLEGMSVRDRCMAENIEWTLEQSPGARTIVWAHDGHVRDASDASYKRMGSYLREKLAHDDMIIGSCFGEGSFLVDASANAKTTQPPQEMRVGLAPPETVEAALMRAGIPIAVFELRSLPKDGAAAKWLSAPRMMREGDVTVANEHAMLTSVEAMHAYDALLFVAKTGAAKPIAKTESKAK
jgi:erythromycin esterase